MAGPYWVVAEGRGTSLTAFVIGPQATQPTAQFAGSSFQEVGAQHGYPNHAIAQEAADIYNAGGTLPNDPSQAAVDKAKSTVPSGGKFSSQGITNRVQQAGGSTAPDVPNPLAGLEGIAHVLGDIGKALLDGKMWRSLGWIMLGVIVFGFGLVLLLKKPIEQAVGQVIKGGL